MIDLFLHYLRFGMYPLLLDIMFIAWLSIKQIRISRTNALIYAPKHFRLTHPDFYKPAEIYGYSAFYDLLCIAQFRLGTCNLTAPKTYSGLVFSGCHN